MGGAPADGDATSGADQSADGVGFGFAAPAAADSNSAIPGPLNLLLHLLSYYSYNDYSYRFAVTYQCPLRARSTPAILTFDWVIYTIC